MICPHLYLRNEYFTIGVMHEANVANDPTIFCSGVRVTGSLVFYVLFVYRCLSFYLCFGYRIACPSMYKLWLPIWFLQQELADTNWVIKIVNLFMKRKFKKWWSTIPAISRKQTAPSHLTHNAKGPRHILLGNPSSVMEHVDSDSSMLLFCPRRWIQNRWKIRRVWRIRISKVEHIKKFIYWKVNCSQIRNGKQMIFSQSNLMKW